MFQSTKSNSVTKLAMSLKDADLMTHLLQMCPVKWQLQYNLMENSTPVSTRTLLLVLENTKSNVKLDDKPPSKDKAKGADSKRKPESSDSCNPKGPRKAGQRNTVFSARNMGTHTLCTTPRSAGATIKM